MPRLDFAILVALQLVERTHRKEISIFMLANFFSDRVPAHIDTSKIKLGKRVHVKHARIAAEGLNVIAEDCKISGSLSLGLASLIGSLSRLRGTISIGRYCSVASATGIYASSHPVDHLTTFTSKILFEGRLNEGRPDTRIGIGHDVWIGYGTSVLSGVEIGNGAVVGAGSVVTRSIAPYTIAVGNPARELRKRFPDDIIALLMELRWWELTPDELKPIEALFHLDLAADSDAARHELEKALTWRLRKS
jgi:acetyltransferase-like isoleucine patch superfamily enzyme